MSSRITPRSWWRAKLPRYFTLESARALLPRLERVVRTAVQAKASQDQAEQSLHSVIQRILLMGGITVDQVAVEAMKSLRVVSMERLKTALEEITEAGCLVKDIDTGLIDFPTLLQGEEVYLCWLPDEPDISFWHNVHEGISVRRPVDRHFIDNHKD